MRRRQAGRQAGRQSRCKVPGELGQAGGLVGEGRFGNGNGKRYTMWAASKEEFEFIGYHLLRPGDERLPRPVPQPSWFERVYVGAHPRCSA